MFFTKEYKFFLSLNGKTSPKTTQVVCPMLITFLREVTCVLSGFIQHAGWLQNYFNATKVNKTEMSYAVIKEYLQECFQPKIGRKIRIVSLDWKNNILIKKSLPHPYIGFYRFVSWFLFNNRYDLPRAPFRTHNCRNAFRPQEECCIC